VACVVAEADGAVVADDAGGVVVDAVEPEGGGGLYPGVIGVGFDDPPMWPMYIPTNKAIATTTISCHVFQDRR
jgi:hypothetical protein